MTQGGRGGVVGAFTEWDPLEEVIVGSLTGAVVPSWQEAMRATMPESSWQLFMESGGEPFDKGHVSRAEEELDGLVSVLEDHGVRVRRPAVLDHSQPFSTPEWSVDGGLYAGMPRDGILLIGDTVIEAPMSWRCRYHEATAFRSLIREYFSGGARWAPAPQPVLDDSLYVPDSDGWAVNESEPVFDAADFMKFGADLVVQRSHVTNEAGIRWVQKTLGPDIRVHQVTVNDPHAMHIDATLLPLASGKLLVNPERFVHDPLFDGWEIKAAPPGTTPPEWPMYFCSPWVSMNLLSIDPETVVVEENEGPLIDLLTEWGFRCLRLPFRHVYSLGGSFHCVTIDVRRRGPLATYLRAEPTGDM